MKKILICAIAAMTISSAISVHAQPDDIDAFLSLSTTQRAIAEDAITHYTLGFTRADGTRIVLSGGTKRQTLARIDIFCNESTVKSIKSGHVSNSHAAAIYKAACFQHQINAEKSGYVTGIYVTLSRN